MNSTNCSAVSADTSFGLISPRIRSWSPFSLKLYYKRDSWIEEDPTPTKRPFLKNDTWTDWSLESLSWKSSSKSKSRSKSIVLSFHNFVRFSASFLKFSYKITHTLRHGLWIISYESRQSAEQTLEKDLNQKNSSSKRSFISSRICSQISRSSGPSSAMKIAPPTERKLKLALRGREKSNSPRLFVCIGPK